MAKKDDEKTEGEGAQVETTDSPLLDLSDAAVKRMIKLAKKRGFVTYSEINAVLPSEELADALAADILVIKGRVLPETVRTHVTHLPDQARSLGPSLTRRQQRHREGADRL